MHLKLNTLSIGPSLKPTLTRCLIGSIVDIPGVCV